LIPRAISVAESVRRQIEQGDGDEQTTAELDALTAPWFAAAVDAWGKRSAYAARIGVAESYLSYMCSGKKPVALRHLLPLHESAAAVQALVGPLCGHAGLEPPQPKAQLTAEQVQVFALRLMLESPPLMRLLRDEGAVAFGVEPDEVLRALGRK